MQPLLVIASLLLISLSSPQAVLGTFQDCPDAAYICPTTSREDGCNIRSEFRAAYKQVTLGNEDELFMNCIAKSEPAYNSSVCVAPSPEGKIVFVDSTLDMQPMASETIEGLFIQYLESTFNFVEFGQQTELQIEWKVNSEPPRTANIDPESLVDTITCEGVPMTAGTFRIYVPVSFTRGGGDKEIEEGIKLSVSIKNSAVPEWEYSFVRIDKTTDLVNFSRPDRSDLVKEAGRFMRTEATSQIVNTLSAPTPSPTSTEPPAGLDEETIIGVSAAGGLILIGAAMVVYMIARRKRSFDVRTSSQRMEPKSKASIKKFSNPRQDKNRNSSSFVTESPLFVIDPNKKVSQKPPTRGSIVTRSLRAAPNAFRAASTRKSTGVMSLKQRNELLEFLRSKETKLSERELQLKVAKLSRYQRSDLIRALNTIYHAVPKSLEAHRASLGLTSDDAAAAIAPPPGLIAPPPGLTDLPPPAGLPPPGPPSVQVPPPPPPSALPEPGPPAPMPSIAFGTPTIEED